uniref:Histone deacetylase interacting domain-containing protein n=1 Tax=Leersia perrieri TaxID=77586 RepID=A0A0D9WKF8_9ORYZ
MESPGDPGDGFPSKRVKTNQYGENTMQCLMYVKGHLPVDVYSDFVHSLVQIRRRKRNISIDECKDIILNILDGQPRVIKAFQTFIQGGSPYYGGILEKSIGFFKRVQTCPDISTDVYNALIRTMANFSHSTTMTLEDVIEEVKGLIGNNTELLQEFLTFVPYYMRALQNEQSCTSPKNSRGTKTVLSLTPDANNKCDGIQVKETNHRNEVPQLKYTQDQNNQGDDESPHVELDEDDEEYNPEPLHQWVISLEDKLPPKVDLSNAKQCTPSYCLLPKNCVTLQSSYQTELGKSILNDSLVSVTSGSEDCFKFRTKNQYEENMFKCEDDLYESDMVLQRFRATVDFIKNLQVRVGSNVKIQEHLTPLHKRCIEQLYDDSGTDMLDVLSESENTSSALAVILSRLNHKIRDLSEARLSLNKICSDIVANNYHMSLDLRSPSFKQLDMKRMNPKALLAEDKQISKTKSHTDIHIHEDIGNIINYAYSRSRSTEDKPMMNWTELVKEFLPVKFQWTDLKDRVAHKKRVESSRGKSSGPTSSLDHFDAEVEEEHYESKEDFNDEVGSSAYSGRKAKAVLCRLLQVMYERLLVAKELSKGASVRDSYAEFKEKLCNLIDGTTDNWNFEQHCLKFLGPNSYVLFTLDKLIERAIKQICKIYPSHEDSSVLQQQDKLRTNSLNGPALVARRINLSKEFLHHKNARGYPIQPSIELSKQDGGEGAGSKPHSDSGKVNQNHFQRRRKRTLEKGAPSSCRPGPEN